MGDLAGEFWMMAILLMVLIGGGLALNWVSEKIWNGWCRLGDRLRRKS